MSVRAAVEYFDNGLGLKSMLLLFAGNSLRCVTIYRFSNVSGHSSTCGYTKTTFTMRITIHKKLLQL